jgi:hypothetical protein
MKRILFPALLLLSLSAFSQSATTPAPSSKGRANSLRPSESEKVYAPKAKQKSKRRVSSLSPEEQFYQRMQAVAKARRKQAVKMQKPQYANPLYFGHRAKPKKHSPKKMKYCKECGIRH